MLIAKSTWVPVGKFPRETVQTDPWCATRSSLRGAIWRPSLRLSDKAAHLVNWHAGLQPCGRRGAGVPDAVPYMLLGMPSPDLLLRWDAGRWADALDPRHLSDVPSLHQGDLRGSRLGSIQATVKVSGQVSFLEIRRSAFITISRC